MLRVFSLPGDWEAVGAVVRRLRLLPSEMALMGGARADKMRAVVGGLEDVARRGDAALVESARMFDDEGFDVGQLRVTAGEMAAGHGRISQELRGALRHAISQVREYQTHILPKAPAALTRVGFEAGLRWTPVDSAGLYFPGGSASYPSTLIMLAVPAQVAGVKRVVTCTPAGRNFSDAVLAVGHELGITEMYRVGGVAAVGAMAFGTETIRPVDKILGPGNEYVQLAKRAVSGAVGTDGFLGPSEILVIADEGADAASVAVDLLAQAEHDPGSCFLVSTSPAVIEGVARELARMLETLPRAEGLRRSLAEHSMAVHCGSEGEMFELANAIACEHVSVRVRDVEGALARLRHAGCIFIGDAAPVAAGDYVSGPSHCLPTNTTARFASGVSVYEFMKRTSLVRYSSEGIARDAGAITAIARAEGLEAHARSVESRLVTD